MNTRPSILAQDLSAVAAVRGNDDMAQPAQASGIWLAAGLRSDPFFTEALFVCELQQSDNPTTTMVAEAIIRTVQRFGTDGCASQMAQEFGDHPDAARDRMRWVRQLAARAGLPDGPQPLTGEHLAGQLLGGTPAGSPVTGCPRPHLNGASPGQS